MIDILEEIEEQTECEKPLINKLKSIKNDMNKLKKINEKEGKLDKLKRFWQYYDDQLEGPERIKTERKILLDNHKEVDNQGLIINNIQENIKAVRVNLNNINRELDAQDEKMDRIQDKVLEIEEDVNQTSKIMNKMERRHNCMKVVTLIAIILFALFDIAWLTFLID